MLVRFFLILFLSFLLLFVSERQLTILWISIELEFLGSPWSEYLAAANSLSLKIIRIPMVEGFAPLSPSSLDSSLAKLIQDHTLKGESILAHCRGGIGRAGLIACVWMIKMGLICAEGVEEGEEREGGLEEEMRVVERVIEVIRRRRR